MSNMRITGMASGMDTDSMVQSMMKVERLKVSRFEQNKQVALWKQEAFNNTNKIFANFIINSKKDIGLKTTTSTGLSLDNSYSKLDYVKKASSSNEMAATASSTSKAVNGSFSIEVVELAKSASLTSSKVSKDEKFGNILEIELNGETIKVENANGVTMKDVAKAINDSKQGVTAFFEVDSLGEGALILQTTGTGGEAKISLTASGDESTKFKTAMGALNAEGSYAKIKFNGVAMTYESNNFTINGINIEAKSIGTTTINVSTNVEGIMEKVEKLIKDYNELIDNASKLLGEKQYPSYKPLTMEEKQAMKDDDVKLWEEKAKSGLLSRDETITRTLQNIRNDLYKTIEGVEGFNHITQIGISTESYARGSTGGKLQIDTEKLRKAIEDNPEGVMGLLFKESSALGGKPASITKPVIEDNETEEAFAGRMSAYEEALKVYKEELRAYELADKAYRNANNGIFTRVYDNLIDGMKSIIDKSGPGSDSDLYRNVKSNMLLDFVTKKSSISDIDKQVLDMNRQMDNLNVLLAKKEDSYYAKFTQMEKYMQQMSGQSSWLSQQFMR